MLFVDEFHRLREKPLIMRLYVLERIRNSICVTMLLICSTALCMVGTAWLVRYLLSHWPVLA